MKLRIVVIGGRSIADFIQKTKKISGQIFTSKGEILPTSFPKGDGIGG